jgi:hypothetical protein
MKNSRRGDLKSLGWLGPIGYRGRGWRFREGEATRY